MKKGFLSAAPAPAVHVYVKGPGVLTGAIGELVKSDGDQVKVRLCAESDSDGVRVLSASQCRSFVGPQPGERLLAAEVRASEATIIRLLSGITWRAGGDNEVLAAPPASLLPDLINHVLSFLTIERVDPTRIQAICCSSIDDHNPSRCALQHVLDSASDTWWISGPNSTPQGVGAEWVAFALDGHTRERGGSSSGSGAREAPLGAMMGAPPPPPAAALAAPFSTPRPRPRRVERVDMRIPPMPSGPLSVRDFHLESSMAADGPWQRASATFNTLNRAELQSWALRPPIEATHVRIRSSHCACAPNCLPAVLCMLLSKGRWLLTAARTRLRACGRCVWCALATRRARGSTRRAPNSSASARWTRTSRLPRTSSVPTRVCPRALASSRSGLRETRGVDWCEIMR